MAIRRLDGRFEVVDMDGDLLRVDEQHEEDGNIIIEALGEGGNKQFAHVLVLVPKDEAISFAEAIIAEARRQ